MDPDVVLGERAHPWIIKVLPWKPNYTRSLLMSMNSFPPTTFHTSSLAYRMRVSLEPRNGIVSVKRQPMEELKPRLTSRNGAFVSRLPPTTDFGPQINFTLWFLTALSAAFLSLRVYCKFLRHRGLWWDDHLLILSWVS